jgi:hypothetical protein
MVRERVIDVRLPRHGELRHSLPVGACAERVRETRGVDRERLGHIEAVSEDASSTAHTTEVVNNGSPCLWGKGGKCDPDDGRRPARKPRWAASSNSSQLSPKGPFERKALHA